MVDYDVQKDNWYSPIKVLNEFEKLRLYYGEKRLLDGLFKRAFEMFDGAVALLGAFELGDNKYWLQSNNQSTTPDVMAGKQVMGTEGINFLLTQMEMVKMEDHSPTDDIVDFLKMTKLSPQKCYTEDDMIVLILNRKLPYNQRKVSEQLLKLKPKPTIYVLGKPIDSGSGDFMISTPYPRLSKSILFNIDKTAAKYWIPWAVNFERNLEKEIKYTKSEKLKPYNTYDILGLNQKAIYNKFGIKEN